MSTHTATPHTRPTPSLAGTFLLPLAGLALWFAVMEQLIFGTGPLLLICRPLNLRLPDVGVWLFGVVRWFENYWYVFLLFLGMAAPVLVLVTWWLRHRLRSIWLSWAWGILLIVPPVVALEIVWVSTFKVELAVYEALQAPRDETADFLTPDGQLVSRLQLIEVRAGAANDAEVLTIEPPGDWKVTRGPWGDGEVVRRGKLSSTQRTALARQLAVQKFRRLWPDFRDAPAGADTLTLDFDGQRVSYAGLRRGALFVEGPPGLPPEDLADRAHFVALVLVIDDLTRPDAGR